MELSAEDRIIVALDVRRMRDAEALVAELSPHVGMFKVGLELSTYVGAPQAVKRIHELGGKVFLDLKFNDIPNTVGGAAGAAAFHGVEMFNVMASANQNAMRKAVEKKGNAKVLAVTVLTSIPDNKEVNGCAHIFGAPTKFAVLGFASDAKAAGVDGVISSPQELAFLNGNPELKDLLKVTPGIRPKWAAKDDQERITTPKDAILNGADYLVIGRPITAPPRKVGSLVDAAKRISEEIESALAEKK